MVFFLTEGWMRGGITISGVGDIPLVGVRVRHGPLVLIIVALSVKKTVSFVADDCVPYLMALVRSSSVMPRSILIGTPCTCM